MKKLSMICATYGNNKQDLLIKLIDSVIENASDKYEIEFILVDQNEKDQYQRIIQKRIINTKIIFKYLKSEIGLSKSRNIGLKHVSGNIICFPDDDCIYPRGFIQKIMNYFDSPESSGLLITKVRDLNDRYDLRFTNKKKSGHLSPNEVFVNCCSISIFHKKRKEKILFDENLGLGSKFKSCEDYDYVLQHIKKGTHVYFSNDLYVLHPDSNILEKKEILKKIENNAIGHGALFRKHFFLIIRTSIYHIITPVIGMFIGLITLNRFKQKQYSLLFKYRLLGFIKYQRND
ncbi:MAG: glycosyltransferase family 2 protein [Oceanospirillaceae bacterium]|nr:glycosyltransferase family 2 protein [Oceanospirillaceae bacterium]